MADRRALGVPVQTEDPMAVAAGYNWIGQSPRPTFAERFGGF
jgi:hypothetical protein